MKLKALVPTVFVLVALPAVALAGAPTQAEASNAAKICAGLKQAMGSPTFRATYGTNATRSDALGKCVCWAKIEQQDTQQATRLCAHRAERRELRHQPRWKDVRAVLRHGHKHGKNAFGRCVSSRVQISTTQQASATVTAANACATERTANPAVFKAKYGTNANKSNAFGRCVSLKATANKHPEGTPRGEA